MAVGHGEYGLRSDLRIFTQLQDESACRADAFVEIDAGAVINDTWKPLTPGFEHDWSQDFDGEVLDVIGVRTLNETLDRVETETQLGATEGTFQYDLDEGVLRIHLAGDADPSSTDVLVITTFRNGTAGAQGDHLMQPYLGNDYFVDGDMADASLTAWTKTTTGAGWTIARATATIVSGGYEALLNATGAADGQATMYQAPDTSSGGRYRYFGYYATPVGQPASAHAYIRVGTTTTLSSDGRSNEATLTDGLELTATHGLTRAFLFDYISHEATPRVAIRLVNGSASACSLRVTRTRLRPIFGFSLFHPRVAAGGVPESEQGSADVYNGSSTIASGSVTLMNGDTAVLERLFSPNPWSFLSREVRIRYGGAFPDDGQVIVWDDMFLGQSGVIAGDDFLDLTDEQAVVSFEADSDIMETILPSIDYGNVWPSCEDRDASRPRVMMWGAHTHIRPCRVDADGSTLLGVYEVNDPTYAVGDAIAGLTVYAYTSEEAAEANDTTQRLTLVDATDYSKDVAQGTFEILLNPGVFVVSLGQGPEAEGANDRIDFTRNGTTYEADLTPGNYTAATLATHVAARMTSVAGATVTATYSNTTHKFTLAVALGTATFTLLSDTGLNKQRTALNMLGFTNATDYTGALTYTGTTAVFTDPDEQNFIRCDAGGYRDDAAGTYTGSAGGAVALPGDFIRYVLGAVLKRPASKIDSVSFDLSRTQAPQEIAVYLGVIASIAGSKGGSLTMQELVDRIEYSGSGAVLGGINPQGLADIRIGCDGVWQFGTRGNGFGSGSVVSLYDYDFMSWRSGLNGGEPSGIIRLNWGQDPSTGRTHTYTFENTTTILRDGVRQKRDPFDTYLVQSSEATAAAVALGAIARSSIRQFGFSVIGKLLKANPGDIVQLYRRRGLQGVGEIDGDLDAVQARIVWIKKNYLTREVQVIAHTNIVE